jgi:hypothetical protein
VNVVEKDGVLLVRYRETRPPDDAITVQVITSPYHIAAAPKPAGEVRFERAQYEVKK